MKVFSPSINFMTLCELTQFYDGLISQLLSPSYKNARSIFSFTHLFREKALILWCVLFSRASTMQRCEFNWKLCHVVHAISLSSFNIRSQFRAAPHTKVACCLGSSKKSLCLHFHNSSCPIRSRIII